MVSPSFPVQEGKWFSVRATRRPNVNETAYCETNLDGIRKLYTPTQYQKVVEEADLIGTTLDAYPQLVGELIRMAQPQHRVGGLVSGGITSVRRWRQDAAQVMQPAEHRKRLMGDFGGASAWTLPPVSGPALRVHRILTIDGRAVEAPPATRGGQT